jgi:hypothetical protein
LRVASQPHLLALGHDATGHHPRVGMLFEAIEVLEGLV